VKNVLLSHRVNFTTRLLVLHCYVWSVLLSCIYYSCETWTICQSNKRQVDGRESVVHAENVKDIKN